MSAKGETARFFDAIARRYDRVYAPSVDVTRASLARVLAELPARSRVLDLGVGTGRELPYLLDAGHSPVGLDVSSEMLAICARRARPIPLVQGDLWAPLPWDDASFDAILALHGTLSHAPSDAARSTFASEVARLLRPGGTFLAEVPTVEWLDAAAALPGVVRLDATLARFTDPASSVTVDASFLSEAAWRSLFEAAGLDVRARPAEELGVLIVARRQTS